MSSESNIEQLSEVADDFFMCTEAKDTVFTNGDYIKYIPVETNIYTIEIRLEGVRDTLDFYLSCGIQGNMFPRLVRNSDFIFFIQGSTSYRYLTLVRRNKGNNSIDIEKFETARSTSAEIDGFVFAIGTNLFFYNLDNSKLLSRELPDKMARIKYSALSGGNKISVDYEQGETLVYDLGEFY